MPYRTDADGSVRVMLITSRETQRWVIPKGNPIQGLNAHGAAAQEAYEEAGIEGIPSPTSIGRYSYAKRRRNGLVETIAVDVFPFAVTGQAALWPERDERTTAWFTLADAAAAVDEPELKAIIANFHAPAAAPGLVHPVPGAGDGIGWKTSLPHWLRSLLPK